MNHIEEGIAAIDTALSEDFYKADKTSNNIPVVKNGAVTKLPWSTDAIPNSVVVRDANKRISVYAIESDSWVYSTYIVSFFDLYHNTKNADYIIDKTTSDTGTLTVEQLESIEISNRRIIYDDQVYYRMDPQSAPDGTLNYIHIDGIQDGNGGYKATGKCFSITVNTREWKVVDMAMDNYLPLTGGTITGDTTIMGSGGQYGIKFTNGDICFLDDGGSTILNRLSGIVSRKGTSPNHAMSQKGVADNYVAKSDLPSNLLKYQIITSTSDIGTDANTAYLVLE